MTTKQVGTLTVPLAYKDYCTLYKRTRKIGADVVTIKDSLGGLETEI